MSVLEPAGPLETERLLLRPFVAEDFDAVFAMQSRPDVAEIGLIVHPDHQGHGYFTEAVRVLLRLAFEELQLHRVIGRAEARNIASARVLGKLGMRPGSAPDRERVR